MRCRKCDEEHLTRHGLPACAAHAKRTGKACRAHPVHGATVCSKHGAQAGQVKRKAAERVAVANVERTVGELMAKHDMPDQHPFVALLDLSRRMNAMTRALEELVTEYRTSGQDEPLQVALGLYERFGRLSAQVNKTVLDANLEERLLRLDEKTADGLYVAINEALRATGLTPQQMSTFGTTFAAALRKQGGQPVPIEG